MLKFIVIILSFVIIGCNKSEDEIKIDKAKVIFAETFKHIKNPSFSEKYTKIDGNKVTLMVTYKNLEGIEYSQPIDVYVIEKENEK